MSIKPISIFSIIIGIVVLFADIFIYRDICTYINGGRPWSETVDGICGIFLHPKRNNTIVRVPISGECLHFTVSHKWRGNYQFRIWVPDEIPDNVSVSERIGLDCTFLDGEGREVYINHNPPTPYASWLKVNRELPVGSEMNFRMYLAPDNVPLDDELTVKAVFFGQFVCIFQYWTIGENQLHHGLLCQQPLLVQFLPQCGGII